MESKRPIQSRILVFNVLSVVAIIITEILASPELKEVLGNYAYILMIAGAAVNGALRLDTTKVISLHPPTLNPVDSALRQDDLKIKDI